MNIRVCTIHRMVAIVDVWLPFSFEMIETLFAKYGASEEPCLKCKGVPDAEAEAHEQMEASIVG